MTLLLLLRNGLLIYTLEETHGLMANVSPNFKGSPFSQLLPSLEQNELHDVHNINLRLDRGP